MNDGFARKHLTAVNAAAVHLHGDPARQIVQRCDVTARRVHRHIRLLEFHRHVLAIAVDAMRFGNTTRIEPAESRVRLVQTGRQIDGMFQKALPAFRPQPIDHHGRDIVAEVCVNQILIAGGLRELNQLRPVFLRECSRERRTLHDDVGNERRQPVRSGEAG